MSIPASFASVFPSQNKHEAPVSIERPSSLCIPLLVLVAVWTVIVLIVNPVGEFMVNDDWAFVRALETLAFEGRMPTTGWGPSWAPGGPSLIVHLLWGRLFTYFRWIFDHGSQNIGSHAGHFRIMCPARLAPFGGRLCMGGSLGLLDSRR